MRRIALPIALAVFTAAPLQSQSAEVPEWFMNPPRRDGWIAAVARGQSKVDALAFAVGEIADQMLTDVQRDSMLIRMVSSQRIGSIRVRTLSEKFIASFGDSSNAKPERTFRRIVRMTSADSSSQLQAALFEQGPEGDEEVERTLSLDGELRIFLDALTGIGARITTAENAGGYYILVSVPQRALRP